MKNRVLSFLASIALLSLTSCTDEMQELAGEQSQVLKQIVMTTQDFQPEADSRTVYQIADGAVKCTWAENDTVGVFPDKGAQAYFPMASGAGTKNASFDGEGWALKDGRTYGAYYPCIGQFYLDRNAVPVSYAGQTQVGNGSMAHLGNYDYMVATPTAPEFGSAQFMFKHLSTLVQLKITVPQPATFTSVRLVTDTKTFALEGKVDIMAKTPIITPVTSSTEVALNLQNVATTKENEVVTLYFMLPPADLSGKTLKAVLASDKGNVEVDLESKNFKAGTAYALSGTWEIEDSTGDGSYKDGVVSLAEAGTMRKLLGDDYMNITSLKVVGSINGDDVYYLRKMLNASSFGPNNNGCLTSLDLSKATIVAGGEWYYSESSSSANNVYYTSDNEIGDYMFYGCSNLQMVVLPNSITSIGSHAFYHCHALTMVDIPDNVTSIGDYAYYNNLGLTSLIIGDGVTTIGSNAFRACYALTSVTIGEGVRRIDSRAFSDCRLLDSVYIKNLSSWCNIIFENNESNPLVNGVKLYLNNEVITDLIIPDDVTEIKNLAFYGYSSLKSVTISDGVISIGSAFSRCTGLTIIKIGKGLTSIADNAFRGCKALISIDIPDNVTSIGQSAFCECDSLSSIIIPNSVTSIGEYAFSWCSTLTSVTLPNSLTTIENYVFKNSALKSVVIPNSVTSIGKEAFYFNNLTSVTLSNNIISIGEKAFYGSRMASLIIPGSIKTIEKEAFCGCLQLTDVYIHSTTPPTGADNFDCGTATGGSYGNYYPIKVRVKNLHVPIRCTQVYCSANWNNSFININEMN